MKVLVNGTDKNNHYGNYILSLLMELIPPENIIMKAFPSGAFSFFQNIQLQKFIKKQEIEYIVQFRDKNFVNSSLSQLIVQSQFEKLLLKKPLSSTHKIAASSHYEKEQLLIRYPFLQKNIYIIPVSASLFFQPLSWSDKQSVKVQYTQAREYFMTNATGMTEETFTFLLKAFSAFKKWQHSGMKLVIAGKLSFVQSGEWKEKMSTYKYREDVVIAGNENSSEIYSRLLASAYTFLHFPQQNNNVRPILEAAQCETPCIGFSSEVIKEYADDAFLSIEKDNYKSLGDAMILLYKDESKRDQLIEAGKQQAQLYRREKSLQALQTLLHVNIH